MSHSRKTDLARAVRKAIDGIMQGRQGRLPIAPEVNQARDLHHDLDKGGQRWGNQRKMRARWKWKDRKSERAKTKNIDVD